MLSLILLTKALLCLVEGLCFLPDLRAETLAPSLSFNSEMRAFRWVECFPLLLLLRDGFRRCDCAIFFSMAGLMPVHYRQWRLCVHSQICIKNLHASTALAVRDPSLRTVCDRPSCGEAQNLR